MGHPGSVVEARPLAALPGDEKLRGVSGQVVDPGCDRTCPESLARSDRQHVAAPLPHRPQRRMALSAPWTLSPVTQETGTPGARARSGIARPSFGFVVNTIASRMRIWRRPCTSPAHASPAHAFRIQSVRVEQGATAAAGIAEIASPCIVNSRQAQR